MDNDTRNINPYLPYNVKVWNEKYQLIRVMSLNESNSVYINLGDVYCLNYKPILRPMSDLNKEITHKGKKVNVYELMKRDYKIDVIPEISFFSFKELVEVVDLLYEYHFDIHGLISEGKAFDYNTLN